MRVIFKFLDGHLRKKSFEKMYRKQFVKVFQLVGLGSF